MLVISRKSQEFLRIGDDILVKVIKTASGSVKIGIEAPGGTRVLRGELLAAVEDEDAEDSGEFCRLAPSPRSSERVPLAEAV